MSAPGGGVVQDVHPHVAIARRRYERLFGPGGPGAAPVEWVLERQATALIEEHRRGEGACAVPLSGLPRLFMMEPERILAARVTIDDAREAVAVEHGFDGWDEVVTGCGRALDPSFEAAVDAVVSGRLDDLRIALDRDSTLPRRASEYGHRGTLLHYAAANGVELRRQTAPPNLGAVVTLLLERGANVDARGGTYGGDATRTPLVLSVTSAAAAAAGVQAEVVRILLARGAAPDGVDGSGAPLALALEFGRLDAARALVDGGARVADLVAAAGLGRSAAVARAFRDAEAADRDRALVRAAQFGHVDVVRWLLDRGVPADAAAERGVTALHEAARGGHDEVVQLLLARGADASREDEVHRSTPSRWAAAGGHEALAERLRSGEK